jgi:predicted metal-dependent phosphoesterase TrpH
LRFFQDDNHAWLTIQEACDLVRNAGGISMLAHPPENITLSDLALLKGFGLDGIEVEYPGFKMNRRKLLKEWALKLEFCIGGGSDCHGVPLSPFLNLKKSNSDQKATGYVPRSLR